MIASNTTIRAKISPMVLSTGKWYHVAAIFGGVADRRLFVNGTHDVTI
jgi:hypothetical protein